MGNNRDPLVALAESYAREKRKAAEIAELPDGEWSLEPATGVLSQKQSEELAVPHPSARELRAVRRQELEIQSADSAWD